MKTILSLEEIKKLSVGEIQQNLELVNRSIKANWNGSGQDLEKLMSAPTKLETLDDIKKLTVEQVRQNLSRCMEIVAQKKV